MSAPDRADSSSSSSNRAIRKQRYDKFLGIGVHTVTFWVVLLISMILIPSVLSHLPLFFGYGVVPGLLAGMAGIVFSLALALFLGHRRYHRQE